MVSTRQYLLVPSAVTLLVLSSCATPATNPRGKDLSHGVPTVITQETRRIVVVSSPTTPAPVTAPTQQAVSAPAVHYDTFGQWRDNFTGRASAQGLSGANNIIGNAHLNQDAIRLDGNQAEFSQMPWQYLDTRLQDGKVKQGILKRRENLELFNRLEARYGVPASIITAIWGIESSYGGNMGNMDLVDALSSLAYEGRRRDWAEGQLTALLRLIDRGDVSRGQAGSWGGGMGHTQFIPGTWLVQGVDGDGDGRKNPMSKADALSSTANYLKNSGWVAGLPVYYEIRLPRNFDYRQIGTRQPLEAWRAMGLTDMVGEPLSGVGMAELWLPAGINGPALLTTQNFEVLKVYNNSSNYALAVAALAHCINSRQPFVASFPREERGLSKWQVQELQRILTGLGYDTQGVDGVIGTNTRRAFAKWQADNNRVPDGFISQSSVRGLL